MNPSSKIGKLFSPSRAPCRAGSWTALLVLGLALAATGGVFPARGDESSVSASLVEAVVDAGQPAEYHIDITNGRPDEAPPAPAVEGLTITYTTETQSRQYSFNGAVHSAATYTYVYSIETSVPGRFVIPRQEVQVGHATLTVPAVTLNVMGGTTGRGTPASQSYFVRLVVAKNSAYIGESIPAEVRVYFGWDVQAKVEPSPVLNGDGFSQQKFTPPQTSVALFDGEQYRVVTYKTAVAGVKTGTVSIGPAEVTPSVVLPRRRRTALADPFFDDPMSGLAQGPPRQVTLDSEPVTVEIQPLPPGKPPDFSGAIGQFKLEAQADPRKAATGDPVTRRLLLRGQGNFDRIEPPVLTDDTGLRTYPPAAKFTADDEVGLSGLKSFEQVVIAESARTSLPGYRFNYFDPVSGLYQTLETPAAAVAITGATIATPTPAATVAASSTPTPRPSPAPERKRDLLYIRQDFGPPRTSAAFLPLYRRVGFWEVQGAGACLLLGLGASARWRRRARDEVMRRRAELQRQRASLHRTLRGENTGRVDFYAAARRLAQLRAAAGSSQPEADLTPAEICATKPLPPEVAGSLAEIFHRYAELAYSGGAKAQEPIQAEERRTVLATLASLSKK